MENTLRIRRAEKRLSQMETAAQSGISYTRYWRIEHNYTDPSDDERRTLAQLFGVSDRVLFPGAPRLKASEVEAPNGASA